MNYHAENVTLLYLMNQDIKSLSLDELYALYRDTLNQVKESEKRYKNIIPINRMPSALTNSLWRAAIACDDSGIGQKS